MAGRRDTAGSSLRRLSSLQHRIYNLLVQARFGRNRNAPGRCGRAAGSVWCSPSA